MFYKEVRVQGEILRGKICGGYGNPHYAFELTGTRETQFTASKIKKVIKEYQDILEQLNDLNEEYRKCGK
ncbi:hypothetical protein NXG04_07415 [Klebsiella pneumoniae]|nr:hypothetical protein [Klebsiella pneumoniae]MDS7714381.1 hypothetical protein [Klebsiella pneumoniae]